MAREIVLDIWWKRWIYYIGWILSLVLVIGIIRGIMISLQNMG